MKNHYARTGLQPDTDAVRIDAALDGVVGDDERHEDLEAARSVLADPERAIHYRRAHLHYRAMAEAVDTLDDPIAIDSHRWRERLVEFLPDESS